MTARNRFYHLGVDVKTSCLIDKKLYPDSAEFKEGIFWKEIHHWQFSTGDL